MRHQVGNWSDDSGTGDGRKIPTDDIDLMAVGFWVFRL